MKRILLRKLLILIILLQSILSVNTIYAQNANTGIYFQAVARDNFSNPAKDRKIYVQSSIIQTTANGTKVLTEEYQTSTDAAGVFSISLGQGTRVGGAASNLIAIDWSKGPYYLNLKISITPIAPTADWNYSKEWIDLGTTPFGVVPYALYSSSSAGLDQKVSVTDTSKMLAIYAKANSLETLAKAVTEKISNNDTSAMLAPYAKMVNSIVASNLTSLTANSINTALNSKVNVADSGLVYVTPLKLASKIFDTTSLSNRINLKFQIADTISLSNRIELKEKITNKSNDNTLGGINANDVLFPTQKAVKDYIAANAASGGVADGGITTIKLADQAVTDAKILNISAAKINGTLAIANGGTGSTSASAARANLGLENIDNTSDANKPVSTAVETALNLKLNTNGNAATATKLVTPRNINGALFDGSADISIPAKFTNNVTINLAGSKSLGKYANGATIPSAGKTLDEFLLDLVTESIHPSYQAPYVSISSNKSASYEIGTSIGLVTLNSGYGQRNGGAMTSTTYYKNGVSLGAGVNSNTHENLTTSISYSVTMTYGVGPVLNDNLGNPDPYGQIAAGSTSSSLTISPFAYKYFGASASNTINDAIFLLAGTSKEVASSKAKSNFNVPISSGAKYIFYAYPASLGTLTSITVEGFGSFDAFSVFTQDVTNASGHVQSYKIYISNNSFESDVNNIIIN